MATENQKFCDISATPSLSLHHSLLLLIVKIYLWYETSFWSITVKYSDNCKKRPKNVLNTTHDIVLWHLVPIMRPPFSFDLSSISIKGSSSSLTNV